MGKKTSSAAENIRVLVRCRPLNDKERAQGYKSCVDVDLTEHSVTVCGIIGEPDRWTFDAVINNTLSQRDIFTQFIMPLVDSVLEGFNATVFAYGQSGSGKTHTMSGKLGDPELEGLTPRCFAHVFDRIAAIKQGSPNKQFSLYVSFVELYNGKVQDLLARQQVPLAVKENKDKTFYVQGAHVPQVKCQEDIFRHMEDGAERRRVASTDLNSDSSRSHSVFTLIIECTEISEDGDSRSVTSKLNLVDLAGSERQSKTGAFGETLKEGCNINLSLSALGTVIDTIVKGKGHVPFRSSPLTMLLKDSLGGSSKTVMFANIGPSEHNFSETVSTLRFADRAKQIKNKPVVNMDTKDQKIVELTELVHNLREKLKKYETEGTGSLEREVEELRERVGELEVSLDSAIKSREADAVDFENEKLKFNMERQNNASKIIELEEQLLHVQNNLQIAETSIKNEQSQKEEIFRLCSLYLHGEEEGCRSITGVDQLEAILKDRSHGEHSAELAHLHTTVQKLEMEAKQMWNEHKAVTKELEDKLQETQTTLKSTESRLRRAKKELNEARESQKAAAKPLGEGHDAASEDDAINKYNAELLIALENAQQMLDKEFIANMETKLKTMQNSHETTTKAYLTQLQKVRKALKSPAENDSLLVRQLRSIIAEDEKTYEVALTHVSNMYNFMHEIKSSMRKAQMLPLLYKNGDLAASRDIIKKIEAVDAREADVYANMLSTLHSAVDKAQTQRNSLIDSMSAQSETPTLLKDEVKRIISENDELRRLYRDSESIAEKVQARLAEEERRRTAQANAEAQIESLRKEYEEREQKLLEALEIKKKGEECENAVSVLKNFSNEKCADVAAQKEIDNIRAELDEERAKCESLMRSREAQLSDLKALRKEVAESERRYVELEGQMNEMKSNYERQLGDASGGTEKIAELTSRLKERTKQLDQMRGLLEKQKALIVKSNEKSEYFQQQLREANTCAEQNEKIFRQKLQERDENFQRVLNQRLEEYTQTHRDDITQHEEKNRKLKKKIKKLETELERLKEDYDCKVCECEGLRNTVGEQKVEQMRLLRRMGQTEEEAEVYEKKEQIQNALERAKEEQRRKKDLFALGEVANVRKGEY